MPKQTSHETLNVRESKLASAMLHRIATIAVNDTVGRFVPGDITKLVDSFRSDPKESLAYARESLFAIAQDTSLDKTAREELLDQYLDAYFDLMIRLDHAAFPETNEVRRGVPEYIPDGFIDMGSNHVIDPHNRTREQLWVDKREILERNKDVLKRLFIEMPQGVSTSDRKKTTAHYLALNVHAQMRPGEDFIDNPAGDKQKLSELDEGICRHQSMLFQVLAQTMGLQSRLIKSSLNGTRHVSNAIRIDGNWHMIDVANPDYGKLPDGKTEWRFGPLKIDSPPTKAGEIKQYDLTMRHSGEKRLYTSHDRMYWRIEHP